MYATVDIEGDPRFLRESAFEKARTAVDILNLFLSSCQAKHLGYWAIYVVGESPRGRREVCFFRPPPEGIDQPPVFGFSGEWFKHRKIEVDEDIVDTLRQSGLGEIIDCFENPSPSQLQRKIRTAVTWFSKAVNAETLEEQFISLVIALESLLGQPGRAKDPVTSWGSIAQTLGDRVAFLLCNDYQGRLHCLKAVKTLYRKRSEIVHAGDEVSLDELFQLDHIVKTTILTFVSKRFGRWADVEEWEKRCKYSVATEPDQEAATPCAEVSDDE